jgi:hypothetical protein
MTHPSGGAPTKDNAHIAADPTAFMESYARARAQLAKLDGVAGVGFGRKITGSKITDDLAIVVHVGAKKGADDLAPEQQIPESFEGYRTDVRETAPITLLATSCDNDQAYPTIQGGIQIEPWPSIAPLNKRPDRGTLGCLVRKRGSTSDDNWYALTCSHVLLDVGGLGTKDGDGIYHPYKPRTDADGIARAGTLLGALNTFDTMDGIVPNGVDYVDCGVLHLDIGSTCFGSSCGNARLVTATTIINLNVTGQAWITPQNHNQITDVRSVEADTNIPNEKVFKVGRTTARTIGRVININVPAGNLFAVSPNTSRPNCIEIVLDSGLNCHNTDCFGWEGDSGAVIVDDHNRAIGLLFGRSTNPDPQTGHYSTYACHIVPVLDALRVCVQVPAPPDGGTSYGTSNATDGSGLTAALTPTDPDSDPTGGTGYVALRAHSHGRNQVTRAHASPVRALTDAQGARLTDLHDALRATDRGRELDDAFADVRREIASLVRRCRPVTIAWHRNRGPAFLARTLNHLRGDADFIPLEIDGVTRRQLLDGMRAVLEIHGSNPLRRSLSLCKHMFPLFAEATTAEALIATLHESLPIEAIEA